MWNDDAVPVWVFAYPVDSSRLFTKICSVTLRLALTSGWFLKQILKVLQLWVYFERDGNVHIRDACARGVCNCDVVDNRGVKKPGCWTFAQIFRDEPVCQDVADLFPCWRKIPFERNLVKHTRWAGA